MSFTTVTVAKARQAARKVLHSSTSMSQLEADLLLADVLSVRNDMLDLLADVVLSCEQQTQYKTLVGRRLAQEPLAYITGQKEFWSLSLMVNENTLVPRPETELVVERTLHHCGEIENPLIADLGTGCGAIALAVASELKPAKVIATDLIDETLAVAEANKEKLRLSNVEFLQGHWTEALPKFEFDLIVANPPYIREGDPCLREQVMSYEPRIALEGGKDGFSAIRDIVTSAGGYLKADGWLIIEHGYDQAFEVRALMARSQFKNPKTFKDLAGLDRVSEGCAGDR